MVKLKGPSLSLDATGSVADSLTFSKWKGRNYLRRKRTPADPKSDLQVALRAMFGFLSSQWQNLSSAETATWEALALNEHMSPFNAYLSYNQARWRRYQAPSRSFPADPTDTPCTWTVEPTASKERQAARLTWTPAVINDNWGLIIYHFDPGPVTPNLAATIAVVQCTVAGVADHYIDAPLADGIHAYKGTPITAGGLIGPPTTITFVSLP